MKGESIRCRQTANAQDVVFEEVKLTVSDKVRDEAGEVKQRPDLTWLYKPYEEIQTLLKIGETFKKFKVGSEMFKFVC